MFSNMTQTTNVKATTGISTLKIKPNEKIKIKAYSNEIPEWLNAIPNKKSITFVYVPIRNMDWDVLVVYEEL